MGSERKHYRYGHLKKPPKKRSTVRKKQSRQQYTTPWNDTGKPKFHKNIPISNYDLLKWCKYLNIPINNVLSRDESLPHNYKQALFIYNLEPSYRKVPIVTTPESSDPPKVTSIFCGC